ncbi:MAG: CHASE2 domain-containing protein [Hyphomicrobiales bacterium]
MKKLVPHIGVFCFVFLFALTGLSEEISHKLTEFRFQLFPHQATGKVVLVAIDAKSIQETSKWPWPRSLHAKLIEKLTDAGATDIAFDIDFSARTTAKEDKALLKALIAAKGSIILPSFKQSQKQSNLHEHSHDHDHTTGHETHTIYTNPLPMYLDHSWRASVNIFPTRNGLVHDIPYGHMQGEEFIPSLSSILAGIYQQDNRQFHIDYSIQASSVPTVSYVDVLNNKVRKEFFKGKKVIIGATATELGDHFIVPSQGIISGPSLQVLATETLLQNRQLVHTSFETTLITTIIFAVFIFWLTLKVDLANRLYTFVLASVSIEIIALYLHLNTSLMIDTSLMHLCVAGYLVVALLKEIDFKNMLTQHSQQELENKKKIFEQVFKDSFTSTIITDKKGKVHFINVKALKLLNLENEKNLTGKHFSEILPLDIVNSTNQLVEQQVDDTTLHFSSHTEIETHEDTTKHIEYIVSLSVLKDVTNNEQEKIITFTFQDITAKQQAELAQKEATIAAINANKAKTEFLTTMSHELRTPLNSILGFSEIIQNQSLGPDQMDKYIDFASDIQNSGRQLLKVVNDILEVTKMESGSIQLHEEKCDLVDIIEDAIEETSYEFKGQSLNITFEHNQQIPGLLADANLCKKTFSAIISNAIKFSPTNEEIKIAVSENSKGEVCISIADKGDGISKNEIENIFKPFYQVDSSKGRHYEGTGLGLTTANAYINLHRGSIKVDSALSKGTVMHIIFPKNRTIENPDTIINLNKQDQNSNQEKSASLKQIMQA